MADRVHANLQIRTINQDCPQFFSYLPCNELSNKCDVSEKLSSSAINFFFLNPSYENLPICNYLSPPSQSHYSWLGFGSGGLPS
jgi:hypothetical protein